MSMCACVIYFVFFLYNTLLEKKMHEKKFMVIKVFDIYFKKKSNNKTSFVSIIDLANLALQIQNKEIHCFATATTTTKKKQS